MDIKKQFREGLVTQNPVLVQLLGMCSTLAITTSISNGLGMGVSVMIILTCSNVVISLLRKIILLIPLAYLLPLIITGNQVFAVYLAEPVADFTAVAVTSALFFAQFRKSVKRLETSAPAAQSMPSGEPAPRA